MRQPSLKSLHPFIPSLFILLGCAVISAGFWITFYRYATNTPFLDDYYDILYFIYLWSHAASGYDKLHQLFWQYHEHISLYSRLIYVIYHAWAGRINFFHLSLIGSLQLLPTALLLWAIMRETLINSA